MSDSEILRQAQADAQIFESLSPHQQWNLLREIRYVMHSNAMYRFNSAERIEQFVQVKSKD